MTRLLFAMLCLIVVILIGGIASLNYLYFDYQNKEDKKECIREANKAADDCLAVGGNVEFCAEHSYLSKSRCDRL